MSIAGPMACISRGALRHNVRAIRDRMSPAELLAVVKDDAYGHGLESVLDVLLDEGVTRFGTLDLDGALKTRRLAPSAMVFAWVFDSGDDLSTAVRERLDIGVTDAAVLERVADAAGRVPGVARIHLKLDTGLHRAGVLAAEWRRFVARAVELERTGRVQVAGLWTHLAEESDDDDSRSITEYRAGVAVAESLGVRAELRHLAASAASFARADARFDLVRVGAFLYGIAPGSGVGPAQLGLHPVMTLRASIASVLQDGARSLAEVQLGGAHGVLSDAAGGAEVAIRGRRRPVVAVDPLRMLVDATDTGAQVGDEVTLFGGGSQGEPTLQEWADGMGTIGEEIVTRLSALIPRIYVD